MRLPPSMILNNTDLARRATELETQARDNRHQIAATRKALAFVVQRERRYEKIIRDLIQRDMMPTDLLIEFIEATKIRSADGD